MPTLTYTYTEKQGRDIQAIHVVARGVTRDSLDWMGTDSLQAYIEIDGVSRDITNLADACGILQKVLEEADWHVMYAEAVADQLETLNQD